MVFNYILLRLVLVLFLMLCLALMSVIEQVVSAHASRNLRHSHSTQARLEHRPAATHS